MLLILVGCGPRLQAPSASPAAAAAAPLFRDTAAESGIDFRLGHGGRSPLTILETAPGGCAFLDYDRDGLLDLLLVGPPRCALYRNAGGGRFEDRTEAAGLGREGEWMGCAVADYDGDGFPDLLLTGYRCTALFRNEGGRRFRDVTDAAGVRKDLWTTSADFADVDGDGDLDLYLAAYVDYRKGRDDFCLLGPLETACGPEKYAPERGILFRSLGNGRFEDATRATGLDAASGKTWGAVFADCDGDGRPDLYLGNDMTASNLFWNRGGRFEDVGLATGTAYGPGGDVMGAMGVDWGDSDGDGLPDLLVTTYFQQGNALFRNLGRDGFRETGQEAGIARSSRPYVVFGGGFLDVENDGDLDLFTANGHIRDNIAEHDRSQDYRQPMQLFLNRGDGVYTDAGASAGPAFAEGLVGRGAAFGDYDDDGAVDIAVVDLEGRARLLRNVTGTGAGALVVELEGAGRNREALGAVVTATIGRRRQVRLVKRGGSVLSAHEPTVRFGVPPGAGSVEVEVRWPGGAVERWGGLEGGRRYLLKEGSGAVGAVAQKIFKPLD